MKRILITGANGLLGQTLVKTFEARSKVLATGIEEKPHLAPVTWEYLPLDITKMEDCKKLFQEFVPEIVINAASYTHVDDCEKNRELCWKVNVKAVENLGHLARRYDAHLIHYSTDYIFDGTEGPYGEDETPNPLGYYGKSKLASENVLHQIAPSFTILRTCVLYGTGYGVKKNFFLWVNENLRKGNKINVVTDQYNNPTLAEDLAIGTRLVIEESVQGVYHMAGKNYINRYDFALAIADVFNLRNDLISPIDSEQLQQQANRPPRGGLKIDLAGRDLGYTPRSVNDSLIYLKWKMERNG